MNIRPYTKADHEAVLELHRAHGDGYSFADPEERLNTITFVVEDAGKLVASLTGRINLEGIMMIDPAWGSRLKRWAMLKRLFSFAFKAAKPLGIAECYACVPKELQGYTGLLGTLDGFRLDDRPRFQVALWRIAE